MVAFKDIIAANSSLEMENTTAVFVGATHGIGLTTLRSFLSHSTSPTVLIIGRPSSLDSVRSTLSAINPTAILKFIPIDDLTLVSQVDCLTPLITSNLPSTTPISLLFQSQGSMSLTGPRTNTRENLEPSIVLRYYSRVRLISNLLQAKLLSPTASIISVLAGGGKEGEILESDLDLRAPGNWGLARSMGQFSTMMTLSLDHLAAQRGNEHMRFVHVFPGLADTGYLGRAAGHGWLGWAFRTILEPILRRVVMVSPERVGERMVDYLAGERYAGKNMWTLDEYGEEQVNAVLKGYREMGFAKVVAEHNEQMLEEALSL